MDSKEIRDRLLRGSENIDRMKAEVNSVIGMLRVCIFRQNPLRKPIDKTFSSPECRWRIWGDDVCPIHFECDLVMNSAGGTTCGFSTFTQTLEISTKIQKVFEALPVLIEGIRKEFPKAEEEWQYILDASTVYSS